METASGPAAWLESASGEKIPLAEKCVLGRAKDCQVAVNSERTSRRHALVYRQGGHEFWLADLGSANGTRLNGRHVNQHRRLADHDRIEIGGATFIFRRAEPSPDSLKDFTQGASTAIELRSFSCWLLVADMVGSTEMVRRLPDAEAAKLTGGWLVRWKEIVEAHQGAVNKFLGDGFLAYWPNSPEVVPEVLGALAAFQRLREQAQSPFRLVLHFGQATSGGAPSLGEESLAGKEVNFAFRMEDLASVLGVGVLLSEPAARHLGPMPDLVPQGRHGLVGFDGQYEFFSL
jgi:class 3 adenylate cyclase